HAESRRRLHCDRPGQRGSIRHPDIIKQRRLRMQRSRRGAESAHGSGQSRRWKRIAQMKQIIFSGILMSTLLLAQTSAMAASNTANISMADKPLRIIRGTAVYKAATGVLALKDDIVETGAAGAQLEVAPELMLVLGPETRVYLSNIGTDAQ